MRDAILQQINLARTSGKVCGTQIFTATRALAWNDILFSAAAKHSADMATRNYFSHTTPEGVTLGQRLYTEGYSWRAAGENIAAGQGSVASVMQTWLASDGHCQNIMNPVFNEVAVACVEKSPSTYGTYWTMNLGLR